MLKIESYSDKMLNGMVQIEYFDVKLSLTQLVINFE